MNSATKDLENKCSDCDNIGWILSNSESGADEIQRCDTCKVYSDDLQARAAYRHQDAYNAGF